MRFDTRYDRWIVVLLTGVMTFWTIAAGLLFLKDADISEYGKFLIPMAILVTITLLFCLPQYYEIRTNGLFLRRGTRKKLLPFSQVFELQVTVDGRSAPVFSTHRILVVTQDGQKEIIAVKEEDRFLKEMMIRCPHLERKSYGLGLPLASPTSF